MLEEIGVAATARRIGRRYAAVRAAAEAAGVEIKPGRRPSPALAERNAAIRCRSDAGERASDLARDYGLTGSRIAQIVQDATA